MAWPQKTILMFEDQTGGELTSRNNDESERECQCSYPVSLAEIFLPRPSKAYVLEDQSFQ